MSEPFASPEPVEPDQTAGQTESSGAADPLGRLLAELILPNLLAVQASQAEQLAANNRLEHAIEELRLHLDAQFAHLMAQLTACRAELAATQAVLKEAQARNVAVKPGTSNLVH
jgi:hypothetical protein